MGDPASKYPHVSIYVDPEIHPRVKAELLSDHRQAELEAAGVRPGNVSDLIRKLEEDWLNGVKLRPRGK